MTIVSRNTMLTFFCQILVAEESKNAQTIIKRYQNHAFFAKSFSVKLRFKSISTCESAAMYPEQNRQFFLLLHFRRPDVQVQTVFTHIFCGLEKFITIQTAFRVAHLRRNRSEMICMINAFPLFCFLRLSPAELSNWGFCIRNPFKYRILWNISRNPLNFSFFCFRNSIDFFVKFHDLPP